jgi:hypothetical protein
VLLKAYTVCLYLDLCGSCLCVPTCFNLQQVESALLFVLFCINPSAFGKQAREIASLFVCLQLRYYWGLYTSLFQHWPYNETKVLLYGISLLYLASSCFLIFLSATQTHVPTSLKKKTNMDAWSSFDDILLFVRCWSDTNYSVSRMITDLRYHEKCFLHVPVRQSDVECIGLGQTDNVVDLPTVHKKKYLACHHLIHYFTFFFS